MGIQVFFFFLNKGPGPLHGAYHHIDTKIWWVIEEPLG
jgi:hypothetical protein